MPLTIVDGHPVHWEAEGSGPGVLLLHAFPLSARMWEPQLAALGGRFRVVRLDLPGFGSSAPIAPASMDGFARAALAVLDEAKVERAAVVGLSMGGYVALALQARASERVSAMALCDTRAGVDSPEGRAGRETTAREVEARGMRVLVESMMPKLLSPGASEEVRKTVEAMILATPPAGAAAALRGMARREDFSGRLGSITCPALLVVGAEDTLTPPAESHAMAERLPNARLSVLPGAGHLSNLEQPHAFNTALSGFLDSMR